MWGARMIRHRSPSRRSGCTTAPGGAPPGSREPCTGRPRGATRASAARPATRVLGGRFRRESAYAPRTPRRAGPRQAPWCALGQREASGWGHDHLLSGATRREDPVRRRPAPLRPRGRAGAPDGRLSARAAQHAALLQPPAPRRGNGPGAGGHARPARLPRRSPARAHELGHRPRTAAAGGLPGRLGAGVRRARLPAAIRATPPAPPVRGCSRSWTRWPGGTPVGGWPS